LEAGLERTLYATETFWNAYVASGLSGNLLPDGRMVGRYFIYIDRKDGIEALTQDDRPDYETDTLV